MPDLEQKSAPIFSGKKAESVTKNFSEYCLPGFLVFRMKRASCMPNTVPNSSEVITDIKLKLLYFFICATERLRTFSVKQHSFLLQRRAPGNVFHTRERMRGRIY